MDASSADMMLAAAVKRDGRESFKSLEKLKKAIIDYRIEPVIFTPFYRFRDSKQREAE